MPSAPLAAPASGAASTDTHAGCALLGRGFRPFFLAAGAFAPIHVLLWLAVLTGGLAAPRWLDPTLWHAHELLFGWVGAAVAGFLLTAVPVWTGSRPVTGAPLAVLAGLWLGARLAFLVAGELPAAALALLDLAFPVALLGAVARPVLRAGERRNLGFPALLLGLVGANALVHLEAVADTPGSARLGLRLGIYLVTLLVLIVAGRITPAFTANALRRLGDPAVVTPQHTAERLVVPAVLATAATDLVLPGSAAAGLVALLAAGLVLARMAGWQTLRMRVDPLVWSLHAGHAWVAVGLLAVAAAQWLPAVPWTTAAHALTAGAFGATILAVMTRVGLGHTGRPLLAPPGIALAYGLVSLGAALRTAGPLLAPRLGLAAVVVGGALWASAFAIFTVVYAPLLLRPRPDGEPG